MEKVSVVMSVYNDKLEFFKQAVESIRQQSYKEWEMIIVNDGDIAGHPLYKGYLDKIEDPRIRYIFNEENRGIPSCMNQALAISSGEYIAKMDSDDIALPMRLEKQIKYMKKHPEVNVLGTYAAEFGDGKELLVDYNRYSQKMRSVLLLFRNSGLIHPTAMMRKSFLDSYGITYDPHFRKAQDYRLWVECSKYSRIHCLPQIELLYRRHFDQISTSGKSGQDEYRNQIRLLQLRRILESVSEKEEKLFLEICNRHFEDLNLKEVYGLYQKLLCANKEKNIYNKFILKGILSSELCTLILKKSKRGTLCGAMRNTVQFLSLEGVCMKVYMTMIFIHNKWKKKRYATLLKKELNHTGLLQTIGCADDVQLKLE